MQKSAETDMHFLNDTHTHSQNKSTISAHC